MNLRVDQGGMTVHAGEIHGVVRDRARQRLMRREAGVCPVVLVPPTPANPFPGPGGLGALDHPGDHFVVRSRADEIHGAQRQSEIQQMGVRVHHTGDHRLPGEIEPFRAGAREGQGAAVAAHERDTPALHGERFGNRAIHVGGVDAGVGDDEIRLLKRQGREQHHHERSLGRLGSVSCDL
jgi:hypothetical protein